LKTALIVSSYFPPFHSAGGSIRLIKFIKHLSSWEWKFVVYTQDRSGDVVSSETLSSFLLEELPEDIAIKRVGDPFSLPLARRALSKSSLGWGLNVFRSGLANLKAHDIDLIFGVTPPFSNALAATLLAWFGKKPLVLDLKDDWVGSPTFLQKNIFRQKIEKLLERMIVRTSSAIITVTPQSFQLYKDRYQYLRTPEKFHLIPNGCDLTEYERLAARTRTINSERFMILSAAWGFRKDYRDITPFLVAIDKFIKRRPDVREKMDIMLLGDSLSAEYNELISRLDLDEIIKSVGAVKREELVEWLWNADLFLLVQPVDNKTAISGTLYEYWATGKAPVLLIAEEGASSTLVEGNQLGRHFHFEEVSQIADYIEQVFSAYENRRPIWIEREGVQNFDRRRLARRMDEIWRKVINNPSSV
jgi:glycosyltransferase involved in cell wall biosynthesis